mmetsp:Transcript_5623/g.9248  ORF Transcript_5623/g.9248 Transcript_5623/m.9248 type:complete len:257 (+) Transcript_5623:499-1269(+)
MGQVLQIELDGGLLVHPLHHLLHLANPRVEGPGRSLVSCGDHGDDGQLPHHQVHVLGGSLCGHVHARDRQTGHRQLLEAIRHALVIHSQVGAGLAALGVQQQHHVLVLVHHHVFEVLQRHGDHRRVSADAIAELLGNALHHLGRLLDGLASGLVLGVDRQRRLQGLLGHLLRVFRRAQLARQEVGAELQDGVFVDGQLFGEGNLGPVARVEGDGREALFAPVQTQRLHLVLVHHSVQVDEHHSLSVLLGGQSEFIE